MEELVRTVILPRLDQLEAELFALREATWPVCQAIVEDGDPLSRIDDKRRFLSLMFKEDAIALLTKKAEFSGITNRVLRDQELDSIVVVKR